MRRRRTHYVWPIAVLLIVLLVQLWEWPAGSNRPSADRPREPSTVPVPEQSAGRWVEGRVRHVFDGDTLELATSDGTWRVRLKGIDAPEYDQPYGDRAREALDRLCDGRPVRVWTTGRDAYDRLLGDVYCGDVWINGQMVSSGHAWHYRRGQPAPILDELESEARHAGKGLWSLPRPTAPWHHRRHSSRSRSPSNASP